MGAKSPEEADNGSEEKKRGGEANFLHWGRRNTGFGLIQIFPVEVSPSVACPSGNPHET
jgi:hypothetical protein